MQALSGYNTLRQDEEKEDDLDVDDIESHRFIQCVHCNNFTPGPSHRRFATYAGWILALTLGLTILIQELRSDVIDPAQCMEKTSTWCKSSVLHMETVSLRDS
jgi:hypothetical protein